MYTLFNSMLKILIIVFITTCQIAYSQNMRNIISEERSHQSDICLRSSTTIEQIVGIRNNGLNSSQAYALFKDTQDDGFPPQQKRNLNALVTLLYAQGKYPYEKLNPKQIAVDYYMHCINSFSR